MKTIEERLTALERLTETQAQIISDLQQQIIDLLPAKRLPEKNRLEPADLARVVKLRADLFDNGTNAKKGKVRFVIKLFVWLDTNTAAAGTIRPFIMNMSYVRGLDIKADDDSLFASVARAAESDDLIGCVTRKSKGTAYERDHVAVYRQGILLAQIGDQWFEFESTPLTRKEGHDPKAGTPVSRWYWNKEDARADV